MISLQTTQDLHNIISTNDATIVGVLIAIVITFAVVIIYLYKNIQNLYEKIQVLNKDFIAELRIMNENTIKQNNSYHEFVQNMIKLSNDKK